MRRPKPVFSIAREMKKAARTNQTIGSAYPPRASRTGNAPVIATAVTPISTTAPPGTGQAIDPVIVAAKMASSLHD